MSTSGISSNTFTMENFSSFVDAAVTYNTQRVKNFTAQQTKLSTAQTKYAAISTSLASVRSALSTLAGQSTFLRSSARVVDESVLSAATAEGAAAGTYQVVVTSLASAQTLASDALTKTGSKLLTAEGAGERAFTVNGHQVKVTLKEGESDETVLGNICAAVNSGTTGVVASVIHETDAGDTLVFQSASCGKAGAMTLADDSGTLLRSCGLLDGAGSAARVLAAASDAELSINGTLSVTRSSNTVTDAIAGVTLDLSTLGRTTVAVATDPSGTAAQVQEFVGKFNSAMSTLQGLIGDSAGQFYLDPLLSNVVRTLQQSCVSTPDGDLRTLASIGLTPVNGHDDAAHKGQLTFSAAVFQTALGADPQAVLRVFSDAAGGLNARLGAALDGLIAASTGAFAKAQSGLTTRLAQVGKQLSDAQTHLANKRAVVTKQYNDLLQAMKSTENQSTSINSMLTSWNTAKTAGW